MEMTVTSVIEMNHSVHQLDYCQLMLTSLMTYHPCRSMTVEVKYYFVAII
jgi:hypothetical protein